MMKFRFLHVVSFLLIPHVQSTFTIGAAFTNANGVTQIGAAGATCVKDTNLSLFEQAAFFFSDGKGVLLAQAIAHNKVSHAISLAHWLVEAGERNSSKVLTSISDPSVDGDQYDCNSFGYDCSVGFEPTSNQLRQYGLVTPTDAAGYTGNALEQLYNLVNSPQPSIHDDKQGSTTKSSGTTIFYSVQGNTVSPLTLTTLEQGFLTATSKDGSDLAGSLYNAVHSVALASEGNTDCLSDGVAAWSAFVHVEDGDGNIIVNIDIPYETGVDPFDVLERKFSDWRTSTSSSGGVLFPSNWSVAGMLLLSCITTNLLDLMM